MRTLPLRLGFETLPPTPVVRDVAVRATMRLVRGTDLTREVVREICPKLPGVYALHDETGAIVYVGRSTSLRRRLLCYFRALDITDKAARLGFLMQALTWEVFDEAGPALIREKELIHTLRPRFNRRDNPRHRRSRYLCLSEGQAPYFYAVPAAARLSWGPYFGASRVRSVAEALNDHFQLRDCPRRGQRLYFADQARLWDTPLRPGCLRYEFRQCLGPCAAACDRGSYEAKVRAAERFLEGEVAPVFAALTTKRDRAVERSEWDLVLRYQETWEALYELVTLSLGPVATEPIIGADVVTALSKRHA